MVTLSPVGLAAAPVANQAAFLATFKEKLCRCVCATSTNQPFATVTYRNETPVLNGTTVFVPIVATITITTPNACKCQAETQVINERFMDYPVYILNKQDLSLTQGKAVQVPFPRMEMNQKTGKTEMVIDITIEANGKTATYVIPESLSVTYAGNLILSTDKMSLASEIEAMKNTAEQILASVDHQKEVLEKSSSLLAELNPVYKEKQETEKRFSAIEETVTGVKGSVDELKKMMSDFIKKMS